MFDWVVGLDLKCPNCTAKMDGWQTKDSICQLANVHYTRVQNFYTSCSCYGGCGTWVEYTDKMFDNDADNLALPVQGRSLDNYTQETNQFQKPPPLKSSDTKSSLS